MEDGVVTKPGEMITGLLSGDWLVIMQTFNLHLSLDDDRLII